jgi:predicted RNA-binding Zn-ribbon protein involved in translation (DUF1610 family)
MRAILHYTEPGDLILDGFSGTGMTGVAAQFCGLPDPAYKKLVDEEWRTSGQVPPKWGARRAVLGDLAPAATFIAANYNTPFDLSAFEIEAQKILDELKAEIGWMYETLHTDRKKKGFINFTVWSEVFSCPNCGGEIVFHEEALDTTTDRVREQFPCPHCSIDLKKDNLQRRMETMIDPATRVTWERVRFIPVLIDYTFGNKKFEKKPDKQDLDNLAPTAHDSHRRDSPGFIICIFLGLRKPWDDCGRKHPK